MPSQGRACVVPDQEAMPALLGREVSTKHDVALAYHTRTDHVSVPVRAYKRIARKHAAATKLNEIVSADHGIVRVSRPPRGRRRAHYSCRPRGRGGFGRGFPCGRGSCRRGVWRRSGVGRDFFPAHIIRRWDTFPQPLRQTICKTKASFGRGCRLRLEMVTIQLFTGRFPTAPIVHWAIPDRA